jgi:3-phenylpropionate/trans-cinnamate dioxygenase ferredoxin reductase component
MSDGIVIAGGGLAAQRAAEAFRRLGHDGPVRMVCAEPHLP